MSALPVKGKPEDPIFALLGRYRVDQDPKKVDIGIGAYRDNDGKPWVLPSVHKVEKALAENPNTNHEYTAIAGIPEFRNAAAALLFGSSTDLSKIASVQTISGTGANHLGALLVAGCSPWGLGSKTVWFSTPTWGNHHLIFTEAGFNIKQYPYWNAKTRSLDFDGMRKVLSTANPGDTVLLHACAHNPTGVDPTREQWKEIASIVKSKKLFVFFDSAYQGFATGDLDNDAWAIRYFVEQQIDCVVAQSFSKNMGLYGERVGCIHVVLHDATPDVAHKLVGELSNLVRAEFSSAPSWGARIATHILTTPDLFESWKVDIKIMADRIKHMRSTLRNHLVELNTPGTWDHIVSQIGMFSFTGLTPEEVAKLEKLHHIYMTSNGRMSMAGVNTHNVEYIAKAFNSVITGK